MQPLTPEAREELLKILKNHGLGSTIAALGTICHAKERPANNAANAQFWAAYASQFYTLASALRDEEPEATAPNMCALIPEARNKLREILDMHGLPYTVGALASRCDLLGQISADGAAVNFWHAQATKLYLLADAMHLYHKR